MREYSEGVLHRWCVAIKLNSEKVITKQKLADIIVID